EFRRVLFRSLRGTRLHEPLHEELDAAARTCRRRPLVGASGEPLKRARGRARRIALDDGRLPPDRAPQVVVVWDVAEIVRRDAEEARRDARELLEKLAAV